MSGAEAPGSPKAPPSAIAASPNPAAAPKSADAASKASKPKAAGPKAPKSAKAQGPAGSPAASPDGKPGAPQYNEATAMERLRQHVKKQGGDLGDGWRCTVHFRADNPKHRGDVYYFPPDGSKRLRSVVEVCKWLGIDTGKPEVKPREQAAAGAAAALAALQLPHATEAGSLTSLGAFDPRPAFRSKTALLPPGLTAELADPSGARFLSSIRASEGGAPAFAVSVRPAGAAQALELAAADSPDKAWQAVAALQRQAKAAVAALAPEAAAALRAAQPLDGKRGLERFCLADERVLRALEGLPGVAECADYKFVEQRHPWEAHMALLAGPEGRGGKRSREDGAARGRKSGAPESAGKRSRAEVTIRGVLDRIIDNIEKKAQRRSDKDGQRRQRESATAAQLAAHEADRATRELDDAELPGGRQPPPPPQPIPGAAGLPAAAVPAVLELWELLGRFGGLLQLPERPRVEELCAGLAAPAPDGRDAFATAMAALADALATEAGSAALDVATAESEDFKPREHAAALPSVQEDAWPEAARRLLGLAALGEAVGHSREPQLSGGPDKALGDFVGSSPFRCLGPTVACQALLAGALPPDVLSSVAALPVGAGPAAAAARSARLDALALLSLERRLAACEGGAAPLDAAAAEQTVTSCRRMLRHIAAIKGSKDADGLLSRGRLLFSGGDAAALAAKWPRPLDLHTVALRNDLGLYASMADGAEAFACDVRYVCDLFAAAAAAKRSAFGSRLQAKRAPEIARKAKAALASGLTGLPGSGGGSAPASTTASPAPEAEAGQAQEQQEDLTQPLHFGPGCGVCWEAGDKHRLLACSSCSAEAHTYCLHPPLQELPEGDWQCAACAAEDAGRQPQPLFVQAAEQLGAAPAAAGSEFAALAALLGSTEAADLTPEQRARVAAGLAQLFQCSGAVREALAGGEAARRELERERRELRAKIKREDREREEAAKARREREGPEPADGPRPRTRAEEAAEASALADRAKLEAAERALRAHDSGFRREPLGHDRAWSRYFLLGGGEAGPGLLCVEACGAAEAQGPSIAAPPAWGCYPDAASLAQLTAFLNPKGAREGRLLAAIRRHLGSGNPAAAPAPAPEAAAAAAAEPEGGAAAMQVDAQPAAGNGPAAMETDAEPAAEGEAGAQPGAESSAEAAEQQQQRQEEGPLQALRRELLELVEGLDVAEEGSGRASARRLRAWRALTDAAASPQDLAAALLLAEAFLPPERLKPWWRLWAFPTPLPTAAGTLAGVRLRLRALKAAVRRGNAASLPGRQAAAAAAAAAAARGDSAERGGGRAGRYPLRERRAAAGALAESSLQTGGSVSEDDSAMARRLQQEEWGSGDGGGRALRASRRAGMRPRQPPPESNGVRATRAASRMQTRLGGGGGGAGGGSGRARRSRAASSDSESGAESESEGESEGASEGEAAASEAGSGTDDASNEVGGSDEEAEPAGSEGGQRTVAVAGRKRLRKAAD